MSSSTLSENAKAFQKANARSPVVSGSVKGQGGEGAYYTLKNGKTYELSKADCEGLPMPWWLGQERPS